jgi:hypothetical protein
VIYALLAPKTKWMGKQMWYTHIIEYYSAAKRNEILMHSTTCVSLENIMQNKTKQDRHKKTNIVWLHLCIISPEIIHEIIETENIIDVSKR